MRSDKDRLRKECLMQCNSKVLVQRNDLYLDSLLQLDRGIGHQDHHLDLFNNVIMKSMCE